MDEALLELGSSHAVSSSIPQPLLHLLEYSTMW